MKKRTFAIGLIVAITAFALTTPIALSIANSSSNNIKNVYADYAVYRVNGGEYSFLEWKEKGCPSGQKGEKGDPGVYPIQAIVNSEGHLILVLSNGQKIDAGLIPPDVHNKN